MTYIDPDGRDSIAILEAQGTVITVVGVCYITLQEGTKVLVDKAGNVTATWASDTGTWVNNKWDDFILWARSKNDLEYDENASGPHSTLKRDPVTGEVTNYETYRKSDPRNPNPFEREKRYDGEGKSHHNKETGEYVQTPHVHDPSAPGEVRPANPEEIPGGGVD